MGKVDKTQPKHTFEHTRNKTRDASNEDTESIGEQTPEDMDIDIRTMLVTMEKGIQNSISALGTKIDSLSYRMDRMSKRLDKQAERLDMTERRVTETEEAQTTLNSEHTQLSRALKVLQDKTEDLQALKTL